MIDVTKTIEENIILNTKQRPTSDLIAQVIASKTISELEEITLMLAGAGRLTRTMTAVIFSKMVLLLS